MDFLSSDIVNRTALPQIFNYRVRQIPFFLENAFKKTTKYFLKFLFLFESTIFPINNEK